MRDLAIGWRTDLAVLVLSGSSVEDYSDHLVVRTPANPTYHWGNCIVLRDVAAVDEAGRWVRTFEEAFPAAGWVAIGLPRMPVDRLAWKAHNLDLEVDQVLAASTLPHQTKPPMGYAVRRLSGDDWEQEVSLAIAENDRTRESEPGAYAAFARARNRAKRAISDANTGAYFGAFAEESLAASLGIIRCGKTARYQDVLTDAPHRRRGLASHLLGVAARWAESYDCDQWVIVTEATSQAQRIYERAGLEPCGTEIAAYRRPAA